jgi:hypothetical protein
MNILLEVGVLGSELMRWPRNTKVLKLHQGNPPIETELMQVRISLGEVERRWLQKAPLNPPPDADRDRRAVATMLSPRMFLKWLRTLLNDEIPPGGGSWDHEPDRKPPRRSFSTRWIPTLEDVLKAWSRNPELLKVVDARMKAYMDFIQTSSDDEGKELLLLKEFEKVWKTVRGELLDKE